MPAPTIQIESMEFDAAVNGWIVYAQIIGADGKSVRTGAQFVPLGIYATVDQIRAALAAMYPDTL